MTYLARHFLTNCKGPKRPSQEVTKHVIFRLETPLAEKVTLRFLISFLCWTCRTKCFHSSCSIFTITPKTNPENIKNLLSPNIFFYCQHFGILGIAVLRRMALETWIWKRIWNIFKNNKVTLMLRNFQNRNFSLWKILEFWNFPEMHLLMAIQIFFVARRSVQ